jgi:hypothetical protein
VSRCQNALSALKNAHYTRYAGFQQTAPISVDPDAAGELFISWDLINEDGATDAEK